MKTLADHFYEAEVEWQAGRRGEARSAGLPTLPVAAPPEFQGEKNTWSPEHLYIASVASCFMTTFVAIAELSKLEFASLRVEAKGKLAPVKDSGYQMTEIVLRPLLVVRHGRDLERACRILKKAEEKCLISNSIRTQIKLQPEVYHEQNPAYPCPPVIGAVVPQ